MGDVTGNLSSKRGLVEGMEERGMSKVINAIVPLSEMFGYINSLRSMTEGTSFTIWNFSRYDIVPLNVEKTLRSFKKKKF